MARPSRTAMTWLVTFAVVAGMAAIVVLLPTIQHRGS